MFQPNTVNTTSHHCTQFCNFMALSLHLHTQHAVSAQEVFTEQAWLPPTKTTMEKEPRYGLSFKMRIFKYFHFLVFYKFSLFSNAIINERNILVNHNHLKETCNELNPNAKPYYITQNALRLEKDSTKNPLYSKICENYVSSHLLNINLIP